MEGMCYVLGLEDDIPWRPTAPGATTKYKDFWEYAKKHLLNERLIKVVQNFREDKIADIKQDSIERLRRLMNEENFEREKVFKASEPAGNFSLWIRAVAETYEALKVVNPKRDQLRVAKEEFKRAVQMLKEKQ
jgi:dynein heavy chain